jgi:hypothetical protein
MRHEVEQALISCAVTMRHLQPRLDPNPPSHSLSSHCKLESRATETPSCIHFLEEISEDGSLCCESLLRSTGPASVSGVCRTAPQGLQVAAISRYIHATCEQWGVQDSHKRFTSRSHITLYSSNWRERVAVALADNMPQEEHVCLLCVGERNAIMHPSVVVFLQLRFELSKATLRELELSKATLSRQLCEYSVIWTW